MRPGQGGYGGYGGNGMMGQSAWLGERQLTLREATHLLDQSAAAAQLDKAKKEVVLAGIASYWRWQRSSQALEILPSR
jgi:glycine/serine hydroxymethyltransferase